MDFRTLQRNLLTHLRRRVTNGELTERGLARMSGLSQPHVHHILSGARGFSIGSADRMLHTLGLSIFDLIGPPPSGTNDTHS